MNTMLYEEVIEFGDSYKVPPEEPGKAVAGEASAKKKGRTVAITTEDMQKRRNDVKARTTCCWLSLMNITTKKTKTESVEATKCNFKAEGSEIV
ncbi:hypothetical protein Tco_0906514 [Tanacetum coccineum]|uniref:Uncharacterized protein n=1 Tax=Tanacetum coccineum TaxID=301880 RepID=A0ABQ4WRW8_9ASTR